MGLVLADNEIDLDEDRLATFAALAELSRRSKNLPNNASLLNAQATSQPKPKKHARLKVSKSKHLSRTLSTTPEVPEPASPDEKTSQAPARNLLSPLFPAEPSTSSSSCTSSNSSTKSSQNGSVTPPSPSLSSSFSQSSRNTRTSKSLHSFKQNSLPFVHPGHPALSRHNAKPTIAQCVTHLKFLHACYDLRRAISNTNGLFGINDTPRDAASDKYTILQAKLKEKRWAVYVARASERFAIWWESLRRDFGCSFLRQSELASQLLDRFPPDLLSMDPEVLPPLDVMMCWHAFMLNPRSYFEDCVRMGATSLWYQGFPWNAVSECIDNDTGEYRPPDAAQAKFEGATSLHWNNKLDSPFKSLECPACSRRFMHPWTTSGDSFHRAIKRLKSITYDLDALSLEAENLEAGTGYADKAFLATCPSCSLGINHEVLKGLKFKKDLQLLLKDDVPMPGTILTVDGELKSAPLPSELLDMKRDYRLFPNRLLNAGGLAYNILPSLDLSRERWRIDPNANYIHSIKLFIQEGIADKDRIARSEEIEDEDKNKRILISKEAQMCVRRMLSRYWENFSPFAVDIASAVIRQGEFIRKMVNIDWLHSPAVDATMDRLILKYTRFMQIIGEHLTGMAVPTLDVDLAWHTHQLTPPMYYDYSRRITGGRFVDHDDKVEKTKLSTSFVETSKVYQKLFGEPYSLCTCWYCEATRATHMSSTTRLLNKSSVASINDVLPKTPILGGTEPHISAHNAIRPNDAVENTKLAKEGANLTYHYKKAVKYAQKDGRRIGSKDIGVIDVGGVEKARCEIKKAREEHKFNGRDQDLPDVDVSNPYIYNYANQPILVPGVPNYYCYPDIYPCNPGCSSSTHGAVGNCATGTCGGSVAAGSCGSGRCSGSVGGVNTAAGPVGGCGSGCGG